MIAAAPQQSDLLGNGLTLKITRDKWRNRTTKNWGTFYQGLFSERVSRSELTNASLLCTNDERILVPRGTETSGFCGSYVSP